MATTDTGCHFVRLSDVLPSTDVMVAIRGMAAAGTRGLFLLQLFKQRNRPEDGAAAQNASMADAARTRITIPGDRTPGDRRRTGIDRICVVWTRIALSCCGFSARLVG